MKSYKEQVATNPAVDMIHLSRDSDDGAALDWAKKESFPWPHIMKDDVEEFFLKHYGGGVPTYVLIDREGNKLATGKGACFAKLDSLGKDS